MSTLPITGSEEADELLERNPLALLMGMLLDQQVTMELAFKGPYTLEQRLGSLDAAHIAEMPVEQFVAACSAAPAIHRYPKMMGERLHELCQALVDRYNGDAASVWTGASDAKDLRSRLLALPGFGDQKTKIFIALLAKRFDVRPEGWAQVAAPYSDAEPRSVADVSDHAKLQQVREWKTAMKQAARTTKQAKGARR
jgi:uncharacterized HhH-GPD family protein